MAVAEIPKKVCPIGCVICALYASAKFLQSTSLVVGSLSNVATSIGRTIRCKSIKSGYTGSTPHMS